MGCCQPPVCYSCCYPSCCYTPCYYPCCYPCYPCYTDTEDPENKNKEVNNTDNEEIIKIEDLFKKIINHEDDEKIYREAIRSSPKNFLVFHFKVTPFVDPSGLPLNPYTGCPVTSHLLQQPNGYPTQLPSTGSTVPCNSVITSHVNTLPRHLSPNYTGYPESSVNPGYLVQPGHSDSPDKPKQVTDLYNEGTHTDNFKDSVSIYGVDDTLPQAILKAGKKYSTHSEISANITSTANNQNVKEDIEIKSGIRSEEDVCICVTNYYNISS